MSRVTTTTLLLASLAGALLDAAPRAVVSVKKGAGGKVEVRIENAVARAMTLSATTYLTLLKSQPPDRHSPLYWAKLELRGVPTKAVALTMKGSESSAVEVDLRTLSWSQDRSGLSPEQPFRRAVPPGEYELQVQIVDDEEHWWRSGELRVSVTASGEIRF